jgi:hypothetical protein
MPTNINFINNANSGVLTTNPPSPALISGTDYNYSAGGGAMTNDSPWLWFNRDVDITDGTTYTFANTYQFGGLTYEITILLTGTATSSNFTIEVSASGQGNTPQDTGQISTVSNQSFNMNVGSLSFICTVDRFLNGSFDDVTITISPL